MSPRNRGLALAAFLLSVLAIVWWLGRSRLPGDHFATTAGQTTGPKGDRPADPVSSESAPESAPTLTNEPALARSIPKALASRLATASGAPRPLKSKKPAFPSNGLPEKIVRGREVERRDTSPDGSGKFHRATVYETGFKYPFLRVEQELIRDPQGRELVTAELVMVADHLLVKLQPNSDEALLRSHLAGVGAQVLRHLPNSPFYTVVLRGHSVAEFDRALSSLETTPGPLAYAEPDFISLGGSAPVIPNDPSFSLQWDMHNTGQNGGTPGADIHAPEAWGVTTGSSDVVVAVIDTGIDLNHPDLAANIWTNPGEAGSGKETDGQDNDNNGYADDVHGWNFVGQNATPMDDHGHGSHTGGTVGAVGNNNSGISGVSQIVRIMALKFLSASGSGTDSDAIEAINYATTNHALLSSNSWGGAGFSQAMYDVIATANAAGVGFVAAAGNSGVSNDKYPNYPANFEVANMISVAATDNTDTLAWFSNFGATTVHLAAPGVNTYSTSKNGGYASMSGTSMATPHVSGAAALLKAANPALSFAQIKNMLVSQCDAQPSLAGKTASGGRLNVARALVPATGPLLVATNLTVDDDPTYGAPNNGDGIASPGETVNVIIPVQNIGAFISSSVQGTIALKNATNGISLPTAAAAYGTISGGITADNASAPFVIAMAPGVAPADVILTLTLQDDLGNIWTADVNLKVRTVGTVSGTVTKVTGGGPLSGAKVVITGPENHTITTAEDGTYSVVLTNGPYSAQATADGYVPSPKQLIVVPPSHSDLNFALGFTQSQVTPAALSSSQLEGEVKTQTITISNNGDQALTYKILEIPPPDPGGTKLVSIKSPPPKSRNVTPAMSQLMPFSTLPTPRRLRDASSNEVSTLPFADGFEDGMWGRWWTSWGEGTREVVSDTAGTGAKSFHFHFNGPDDHFTGIHQEFDWGTQPGHVSFWTRPGATDLATSYMVLLDLYLVLDNTGLHYNIADFIWFFANANGRFYVNDDVGGNQAVEYTEGQWYHIEFRNINWSTKSFDYWVNGQLVQAEVPFRNPNYASGMLYALTYNYSGGTDMGLDDAKFYDSELPWINLSSKQGSVPPGGSTTVTVTFDATKNLAGSYTGSLLVQTDDPATPATSLPVSMTVHPVANTAPVAVAQVLTLGMNTSQTITLGGSDANGDPLKCKIIALPSQGSLFQTSDGITRGTQITNTPTIVSHPQWKVIYQPATGGVGAPYSTFGFLLHDPKTDSAPATISMNVGPVLTVTPAGATSFNPVSATFTANDPGALIRFTTDSSAPTPSSPSVANGGTWRMDHTLTVTGAAFLGDIAGPVRSFTFNITDANHNSLPDWWESQHPGIGVAGAIDPAADNDGDGVPNGKEFVLGTDPAAGDTFIPTLQNPQLPLLSWSSISGRLYSVEATSDLVTWQQVSAPRAGTGNAMSWQETQQPKGARFYRVKVSLP